MSLSTEALRLKRFKKKQHRKEVLQSRQNVYGTVRSKVVSLEKLRDIFSVKKNNKEDLIYKEVIPFWEKVKKFFKLNKTYAKGRN